MDYFHRVLLNTNYPDRMVKESEKKLVTPITNPENGLEVKEKVFISVPYIPGLSEEFRTISTHTSVQVIFKGANILKSILMYPKIKFNHK